MKVGEYRLEQDVSTIVPQLRELTYMPTSKGEKVFDGGAAQYLDLTWRCLLYTFGQWIYKITLTLDMSEFSDTEITTVGSLSTLLEERFGSPAEADGDSYYVWEKDWGDLIYMAGDVTNQSPFMSFTAKIPKGKRWLKRLLLWDTDEHTEEENARWLVLRSIEWKNWPAFISQPIFPIAIIFFEWWKVVAVIFIVEVLWTALRYRYVNPKLSDAAVLFVKLKWISIVVTLIYLLSSASYSLALLALAWILGISGLVTVPGKRGTTNRVAIMLARKMGYKPQSTQP